MIQLLWRALVESESGVTFVVSPRTGQLLAFSQAAQLDQEALDGLRRRERLLEPMRVENLTSDDADQGYLGQSARPRSRFAALSLRIAWLLAEALARFAPLDRAFKDLDRLACSFPEKRISIEQVLDTATFAERSFYDKPRTQRCLPRTLLRFFLFRLGRYPVEANIGLWIPTEMMHAWISLDGVPLGEEREEVMHYQPCLRFAVSKLP